MRSIVRSENSRGAGLLPSFGLAAGRSPWTGLESELDRLFDSAFSTFSSAVPLGAQTPVDLYQDKDNIYLRIDLPGFEKDKISVELVNGYLSLKATRHDPAEGELVVERSLPVPEALRADDVSALYENGVLAVTLPKEEAAKPKKVAVSVQ